MGETIPRLLGGSPSAPRIPQDHQFARKDAVSGLLARPRFHLTGSALVLILLSAA